MVKKIAVLTSGGDAPGMNAVIRAITRCSLAKNIEVIGINHGFAGLRTGDSIKMNLRTVSDIIHRGGTILCSSRDPIFKTKNGLNEAVCFCKKEEIDAVISIGGDGTLQGVQTLAKAGINSVFIPATIDNDVACSEYSIGYDTAMNTAMEMVDKLRDTAQAHEKCSVVEVMGRNCGDIAVRTGIAVGATAIIVPERKYNLDKDIIERIKYTQKMGKKHFIVIVAEGCENTSQIAKKINEETGIDSRYTILGHVQRGGSPTLRDRVIAGVMGCYTVNNILLKNLSNRVVSLSCNKVVDYDIDDALKFKKCFDDELYSNALEISI